MTAGNRGSSGVDRFREYLREYDHPVTPQRIRVAELLFGTHRHISAEQILERLRDEGSPVGKATVYRTLDLLLKAGLIREHDFGEGFRRYEPLRTRPHHEHLVCTRCGKVIEFQSEEVERIEREVSDLHRFRPSHHKMEIYGACEECREEG
ncbi:MAG: Fur family transcriptional regulator [Gemmatimonadota bacterium]|nr:Fur family transcriptional regulator [Gemmatimonadota bacterium]